MRFRGRIRLNANPETGEKGERTMDTMRKIDLHMHSTVSDGTDTPVELLERVRQAGLELFALTDHDAIKGYRMILDARTEGDPKVLPGVEFSCKDEQGKYHILGYNYDPESAGIRYVVDLGHRYRMKKLTKRLDFIRDKFGFSFPEEEEQRLYALDNPGKPHIANLMVKYGYAPSKEDAFNEYLDQATFKNEYVRPEEAIQGILASGGIPVLAHPAYGSGDELIVESEMDDRLKRLIGYGLQGVEAFYSGFSLKLRLETLYFAKKYDLYVTAGSDYHGKNKMIAIGDTWLDEMLMIPVGMKRFFEAVGV
jgi:predicted metal-dependent phosphoesterase TrpH